MKDQRSHMKNDSDVKTEISCGAVVYQETADGPKFLLVRSMDGLWGFPKGHMEDAEDERTTAFREILEETGICVRFTNDFREEISYEFGNKDGQMIRKRAVYFLAACDQTAVPVPQENEISETGFFDYETALSRLRFEDLKNVLKAACNFVKLEFSE